MTGKPTPGPWATEEDPSHYYTLSTVVAGERDEKRFPGVQMVVQVGGFCGPIEQEANARLIAAAGTSSHQLYESDYDGLEAVKALPEAMELLRVLGTSHSSEADIYDARISWLSLLSRLAKKETPDDAAE